MAVVLSFPLHARASSSLRAFSKRVSSSLRAAKSAKTSSVISELPRSDASATTAAQCPGGMPLMRQPLTVDVDCSSAEAAMPSPPGTSPQMASMTESQVNASVMDEDIVRNMRTCQVVAICETTFRKRRDEMFLMDTDHDVARRLVAVREHFKRSQVAFAEELHIAKNTLNGYETAARQLTIETARRIRDRYGVSVDWLLFGDVGQPSHDLAVKLGPAPKIGADDKKKKPAGTPRKVS